MTVAESQLLLKACIFSHCVSIEELESNSNGDNP